jgi:hypothetical protein
VEWVRERREQSVPSLQLLGAGARVQQVPERSRTSRGTRAHLSTRPFAHTRQPSTPPKHTTHTHTLVTTATCVSVPIDSPYTPPPPQRALSPYITSPRHTTSHATPTLHTLQHNYHSLYHTHTHTHTHMPLPPHTILCTPYSAHH